MDFDSKNRSNNYTIEYSNQKYGYIRLFVKIRNKTYIIIEQLKAKKDIKFENINNFDVRKALQKYNKFFKIVISQKNLELILLEEIVNKCIIIKINSSFYFLLGWF